MTTTPEERASLRAKAEAAHRHRGIGDGVMREFREAASPDVVLGLLDQLLYYRNGYEIAQDQWLECRSGMEAAEARVATLESALRPFTEERAGVGDDDQGDFCTFCTWEGVFGEEPRHDPACPILAAHIALNADAGEGEKT